MGYLISEDKKFINENIFKYEERMNSQYSRFLDKTPTFVTYYHINNILSTADNGFENAEKILGENSPIKFNQINDFPVYGLEQVLLDLNDEEEGLNTSYDSELIILPNTIQPLPNDFFTISYLDKSYLFMITDVKYDTIKSNNYYKVSFTLKSISEDAVSNLERQVDEKYNCIIRNIGTKEKCLIREDDYVKILELNEVYKNIADQYKILFFNTKYNSFLYLYEDKKLYDKYLTHFINSHRLFAEKFNYDTVFLTNEDASNTFMVEYEKCIYRIIEKRKKDLLKPINYIEYFIKNPTSIFSYYHDSTVKSVMMYDEGNPYISHELIDNIINNIHVEDESILASLLIDYFNDKITSVYNIDLNRLKSLDYIDYDMNSFVLIPIVLYIIRYYYDKFMAIN